MNANQASAASTLRTCFLARLFRGEIPLVVTFWIFGFTANLAFALLFKLIEHNVHNPTTGIAALLITLLIVYIIYTVFILTAIWRSASNYIGTPFWAHLARMNVIAGAAMLAFSLYAMIPSKPNLEKQIALQVQQVNKNLPTMLDSETRLNSVYSKSHEIIFTYTLVNFRATETDPTSIINYLKANFIYTQCKNEEIQHALSMGITHSHLYLDQNGKKITKILLNPAFCDSFKV